MYRRDRGGTQRGTLEAHLSYCHQATTWHTAGIPLSRGLVSQGCLWLETNVTSVATEETTSWPRPLRWTVPVKSRGLGTAATFLQGETRNRESCLSLLDIWQSESLSDRPSLKWCLSTSSDTEPCWLAQGLISPNWWLSRLSRDRRSSLCSSRQGTESVMIGQLSRYWRRWIPHL